MKKRINGTVERAKMQSTAVVAVENWKTNALYRKRIKKVTRYIAHNEGDKFQAGDKVVIEECRPISKTKSWTIVGEAK